MAEQKNKTQKIRKIIHIDMDAFFASVEIRDNPQYRGKPLIVGGPPDSRGVVSTCSYEARKYGIHSAMPSSQAYRLCPHAIFVRPRFEAYKQASQQIHEIFYEYTDQVEPVSIDEAYLDVTENKKNMQSATLIAKEIRQKIFKTTKLTASAGVSYNKFLAKIASDLDKPDGLVVIPPEKAAEVLNKLPIGKFHGIGKVTNQKMLELGISNGADLKKWELKDLIKYFGKAGKYYYDIVRGIDNREVKTDWVRKSLGTERTFSVDIDNVDEMLEILAGFARKISSQMQEKKFKAQTITLKLKYANFDLITRNATPGYAFNDANTIMKYAKSLLLNNYARERKIRLLGISVSHLVWEDNKKNQQLILNFYKNVPPEL